MYNKGELEPREEEITRVRPRKKLKPNPSCPKDESPERTPLGLLSNTTRAPIIGRPRPVLFKVYSQKDEYI